MRVGVAHIRAVGGRIEDAWQDGVDPYVLVLQLLREGLGQPCDSGLGGCVGAHSKGGPGRCSGSDVHDRALA
ncbi:hypothetical protein D3C80_2152340 [compost metagenome]